MAVAGNTNPTLTKENILATIRKLHYAIDKLSVTPAKAAENENPLDGIQSHVDIFADSLTPLGSLSMLTFVGCGEDD
jgi:hypothetical protein